MLSDITARHYMSSNVIAFQKDDDVLEAISKLLKERITGAPVLNEQGKMVGMLSEAECIRVVLHATYSQSMGGRVGDFMSEDVATVDVETSIVEVAEMFDKTWGRSFPVVDDVELVGVISRMDVLKAMVTLR